MQARRFFVGKGLFFRAQAGYKTGFRITARYVCAHMILYRVV
jgi:hypothetical protein